MDNRLFFPLLIVMVLVTYLLRMLPFVLFRRKIENARVKRFFEYLPYAILSAMTIPSILFATSNMVSATLGLIAALILAYKGKNLPVVACAASLTVLTSDMIFAFLI